MSQPIIEKSIFIAAEPSTVWVFLTDKDKLGTWYHPAEEDLELGKSYSLYRVGDNGERIRQIWGRVLEMRPVGHLVTTFVIDPFGDQETTITWKLDAVAGGTRLSITHEGIAEASGEAAFQFLSALDKGWDLHFADLREQGSEA